MEKTYNAVAVCHVSFEQFNVDAFRPPVWVVVGQRTAQHGLEPPAELDRSGRDVADPRVSEGRDPEGGSVAVRFGPVGTHVGDDATRSPGVRPEVSNELIARLHTVLQHEAVSGRIVGDVLLDEKIVRRVDDDASLIGVFDRVPGKDTSRKISAHVRVKRVPAKLSCLQDIAQKGDENNNDRVRVMCE